MLKTMKLKCVFVCMCACVLEYVHCQHLRVIVYLHKHIYNMLNVCRSFKCSIAHIIRTLVCHNNVQIHRTNEAHSFLYRACVQLL